jgi:glycosyltransferase involved in cell wall biosynthesis
MLYYGRKEMAEESMESFLRQTYPNKKLLIVNDHPDPVVFEKEYPNVKVYEMKPNAFKNLNEKYNYAFSQIKSEYWCPWESDDIWLPWHLENLVKNIPQEKTEYPKKVGTPKSYFCIDNEIVKIGWQLWTGSIYETFNGNKIYPHCDDTKDENCDTQILFSKWTRNWLWQSKGWPISLMYRWHENGHASRKDVGDKIKYQEGLKRNIHSIPIKEPWRPHWKKDYVKEVEKFNKEKENL